MARQGAQQVERAEVPAAVERPRHLAGDGQDGRQARRGRNGPRLGTAVTLYETLDRVLPSEEPEISRVVERAFKQQGVQVRTGTGYDGQAATWIVVSEASSKDGNVVP